MSHVGVASLERIEALIANSELYALADAIPQTEPSQGGRPRQYPPYMWVLYDALLSVYGSARRVEAELAHPLLWNHIRTLVEAQFPNDPDNWLPEAPMRRHHYLYARTTWLTRPEILERLRELHREAATDQAGELGLLDPNGDGSWTHPSLSRMLYADGKVLTPLYRAHHCDASVDPETGEVKPARSEPDGALHFEGTGETAWGTKWVHVAVRSEDIHGRVILDVAWVPEPGGEASVAMASFESLAPLCVGAQGVIYDTALRGVHHQRLLRDLGWLSVNRVTAAVAAVKAPRRRGGQRVEKSTFIEDRVVRLADGSERMVSLFARGGAVGIVTIDSSGARHFTELTRARTHRNADKQQFRWYNDYRLPAEYGGGTISVRLHANAEDDRRKFNRAENVRPIPPTDPDFARLYRRRNDAESINRALDDTLWLRRAHSVGHARQHLNLLTHALMVNSLALHRHRRSSAPPLPSAA